MRQRISIGLVLGVLALGWSPRYGAAHAQPHEHAAQGGLELDHGKKWASDEALRGGMSRIRAAFEPQLGKIHASRLASAEYLRLAELTQAEVGSIFKSCKLVPKADAVLHVVLSGILDGVRLMRTGKEPKDQRAGAVKVVSALGDYGRLFDHPGWRPMDH